MGIKEDLKNYPCFRYFKSGDKAKILEISPPSSWGFDFQAHHYIKNSTLRRHPELQEKQKLYFLPVQMHLDIHSAMSTERFFSKWKVEKESLLYNRRSNERFQEDL